MNVKREQPSMGLLVMLAAACGFAVANIYYNQTMLPSIGATFGKSAADVGWIATLTQLGYASGLLLFVPLGDRLRRRNLILCLLVVNMLTLLGLAFAADFRQVLITSAALGLSSVSAQVIIPVASSLVSAAERGKVVGLMVSGLSTGAVLARTLSGFVSAWAGWRGMFALAAGLDFLLFLLILWRMPLTAPATQVSYRDLLISLWKLWRKYPQLRQSSAMGATAFAGFSAFWGSMASLLALSPYGYSSDHAGLFGLASIVGVCASATIGKLTDRLGVLPVSGLGAALVLLAFVMLYLTGGSGFWWCIALCAAAMDLGNRANQIANQTRILALAPEAVSRLNTVFMMTFFLGGALGSAAGSWAAAHYGWHGMAMMGGVFIFATLTINRLSRRGSLVLSST